MNENFVHGNMIDASDLLPSLFIVAKCEGLKKKSF